MLIDLETAPTTVARTVIDVHNAATESSLHPVVGAPRQGERSRVAFEISTLVADTTSPSPAARTIGTP